MNVDNSDIKLSTTYDAVKKDYSLGLSQSNGFNAEKSTISTGINSVDEDHPVVKFKKIVRELDLIEKDLTFYKNKVN